MAEREHRYTPFNNRVKERVRKEQERRCAICGKPGHLEVHHKIPDSHGGANSRDNALGVCAKPCHEVLDKYALEKRVYFPEVTMAEGFWHDVRTGLQERRVERQALSKQHKLRGGQTS